MKVPPVNILIPPRGMAMRGVMYTRLRDGKLVYCKWPRKQPSVGTIKATENRARLIDATRASLYMDAHQQLFSRELSKNSLLLPRDLLMMALFGRIGTIVLTTGRKIYSMAARQDVSNLLDAITQTPQHLLLRGPDWWSDLPPGAVDQVLSVNPDGELYWRDTASGDPGGGHWFYNAPPMHPAIASTTITTNFWVGTAIIIPNDTILTGVRVWIVTPAGATHGYPALYQATPSGALTGGSLVAQGPPNPITANAVLSFPLSAPTLLIGGQVYYIGLNVRGAGNYGTAQGAVRPNSFFSLPSDTAPAIAPVVANQQSNNNPIWGY